MKKTILLHRQIVKKIPEKSGVYIFKNKLNQVLYIGKAKNLKKRVSSYFTNARGVKTQKLMQNAASLTYITVVSEIEALLLEAKMVKKYRPRYNVELLDDKSNLYIGITDEDFPRVVTYRQSRFNQMNLKYWFGPFLNSASAKKVLREFRKIIPYGTHKPGKRKCIYSQIGLCNPCVSEIVKTKEARRKKILTRKYKKNIAGIKSLLSGNIKGLKKSMEKEMLKLSRQEKYEEANELKQKLQQIDTMLAKRLPADLYMQNPNLLEDIRQREINSFSNFVSEFYNLNSVVRIECFDVAHLSGSYPTASMVTFINAEPEKKFYRHFSVSAPNAQKDTASMAEVVKRRLKYLNDWGKPDLVIVDGGKPQLGAVYEILKRHGIPVVGIAKSDERLVFKVDDNFFEKKVPTGPALNLVQRIRDEAHRFARRYHHKLVSRSIKEAFN